MATPGDTAAAANLSGQRHTDSYGHPEMGGSYRDMSALAGAEQNQATDSVDPDTGEITAA